MRARSQSWCDPPSPRQNG
uniref:GSVIVT00036358001 n=1 Tax=Arundo donax TaxID=35708 RepID=A0A0A8Y7T5_ARUDO